MYLYRIGNCLLKGGHSWLQAFGSVPAYRPCASDWDKTDRRWEDQVVPVLCCAS